VTDVDGRNVMYLEGLNITIVDGKWGKWTPWTTCRSCEGIQMRNRRCDDPRPKYNGKDCPLTTINDQLQTKSCSEQSHCKDTSACQCGKRKFYLQDHILGGKDAKKNEFPWAAYIKLSSTKANKRGLICGGSLINSKFVVTAAHCLSERDTSGVIQHLYDDITIVLGEHDVSKAGETRTFTSKAVDVREHRRYHNIKGQGLVRYDIALLELETPVDFAKYPKIRPVCLPEPEDFELTDKTGVTVGWGATAVTYEDTTCDYKRAIIDPTSASPILKILDDFRFETLESCNETFYDLFTSQDCPSANIQDSVNLCATSLSGDICAGDSGGGLVTLNYAKRNYVLVGITSFNLGCNGTSTYTGEKLPSVFTDVRENAMLDWIKKKTKSGIFCNN